MIIGRKFVAVSSDPSMNIVMRILKNENGRTILEFSQAVYTGHAYYSTKEFPYEAKGFPIIYDAENIDFLLDVFNLIADVLKEDQEPARYLN
jgi:hypothetical protein